jgi:hypothetical protein
VAAIRGRAQEFVGTKSSKRSPLVRVNRTVTTHMVQMQSDHRNKLSLISPP